MRTADDREINFEVIAVDDEPSEGYSWLKANRVTPQSWRFEPGVLANLKTLDAHRTVNLHLNNIPIVIVLEP